MNALMLIQPRKYAQVSNLAAPGSVEGPVYAERKWGYVEQTI